MNRLSSMALTIALTAFVMALSFALIAAGWLMATCLLKEIRIDL